MMKNRLLAVLLMSFLLASCTNHHISAPELARIFVACKSQQFKGAEATEQCIAYSDEMAQMTSVITQMRRNHDDNVGARIIAAQTKLVTIQQEFDKKDLNEKQAKELQLKRKAAQRDVLVLRSVFLLAQIIQ